MAVRAGLGIGMLQKAMARHDPDLVLVLHEVVAIELDCWIAVHRDQKDASPIRAVFDALSEGLRRWIDASTS